jgi:hypothetical protein
MQTEFSVNLKELKTNVLWELKAFKEKEMYLK